MAKISVKHTTLYRYDQPVRLGVHVIRLRPRDDGAQRLLCHDLRIDPAPALCTECTDPDGSVVTHAWFEKPTESLQVHSTFQVETLRENPFDFRLSGDLHVPAVYPEPLGAILTPYLMDREAEVFEFARAVAEAAGWKTMGFLMELTARIHGAFRQLSRPDGPPLPAGQTLQAGSGACRDLAVLFGAACRAMGLAARFVSGYEREAARDKDHAAMHAWAEVYLVDGGWRGFDPSQGLAVGASHVAVAASRHPEMAAPITGSYLGGSSTLQTSVQMDFADSSAVCHTD